MHLSEGTLRAYLDEQGTDEGRNRAQSHLETCPQCREQAVRLKDLMDRSVERLRMSRTSSQRRFGLRLRTRAATPAAPGQALEVPPKLFV